MAREYNASITFDDAHYMVANEGYTQLETNMPTGTECMTRAAIEWFLDTNKEKFSACAMNQLVPYHLLEPKTVLAWRAIDEYCVQEDIPVTLKISSTNVSTAGGSDGTATVRVTSGTAPFDYVWSNGSTTNNSTSNTNTISNLTAGTYSVTVTSADGVSATISTEVVDGVTINVDTKIKIYFDSSGSMNSTLVPLTDMKNTILKDRLLPLYNNDEAAYDANVEVISQADERTIDMLNINGTTPTGNVISLVFQDEASNYFTDPCDFTSVNSQYITDISNFRTRLENFSSTYYRGVLFQVNNPSNGPFCSSIIIEERFQDFITGVRYGYPFPYDTNSLADKTEINYKYNVIDGGTESYYLNLIVEALEELGYNL